MTVRIGACKLARKAPKGAKWMREDFDDAVQMGCSMFCAGWLGKARGW